MISAWYLRSFATVTAALMALFLAFTLVVDPYGISPLGFAREHVNRIKPARVDIDRFIKPFEVWKYQPKTLFLGSSRIQQGMDPAVLTQSRFAPAYNSSVPASSVPLNVAYLRQYVDLNPQLRTVVFELFFYQFIKSNSSTFIDKQQDLSVLADAARLFLSGDALWASIKTVEHNFQARAPVYEIRPGGFFYYPPGHNSKGGFDGFAAGIWKLHETRPDMTLDEDVFESFRELVEICRSRNIELVLLLTPNHAYDDFYIDSIGGWDTMQGWLRRVSAFGPIHSFSQPNSWVDEPVAPGMVYWNDPYHFTLEMGRNIQVALAGGKPENTPSNFMMTLTPDMIAGHVAARRRFVRQWAGGQAEFMHKFEDERRKWVASR